MPLLFPYNTIPGLMGWKIIPEKQEVNTRGTGRLYHRNRQFIPEEENIYTRGTVSSYQRNRNGKFIPEEQEPFTEDRLGFYKQSIAIENISVTRNVNPTTDSSSTG